MPSELLLSMWMPQMLHRDNEVKTINCKYAVSSPGRHSIQSGSQPFTVGQVSIQQAKQLNLQQVQLALFFKQFYFHLSDTLSWQYECNLFWADPIPVFTHHHIIAHLCWDLELDTPVPSHWTHNLPRTGPDNATFLAHFGQTPSPWATSQPLPAISFLHSLPPLSESFLVSINGQGHSWVHPGLLTVRPLPLSSAPSMFVMGSSLLFTTMNTK